MTGAVRITAGYRSDARCHGASAVPPDGIDCHLHQPGLETTPHVDEPPSRIPLPTLAAATTAIIYMQILAGALMST